ncbi:MAG: GntR family transcriptional regulator [Aeromonadales bacterium]|nr:GntR family transcriptional regulator [Aeromonadales bacterium]
MENNLQKDIIYSRIKQMIIDGQFGMGKKISERILEQTLGANKAPIRDALKRLQAEGLVVRKAKSGTYVFALSKKELLDLLNFRFVIESQSVILSFANNQDKLIDEVEKIILKMRLALALNQGVEYLHLDSVFHESLVNLCNNSYFITSFERIAAIMDTARNFLGNNLEHMQKSIIEHQNIADAIKEKNIGKVVELLREHILPDFGAYWQNFNLVDKE